MQAIFATIQDSEFLKGYFISFYSDSVKTIPDIAPVSFYLTEEHGLQDLRICGDLLGKLEWLKGAIEVIQMLQKH